MRNYKQYNPIFVSLLLYFVLWIALQPVLGFMLDSDAVAYLTIAKRVADGDYFTAINGLWSPLNSWLIAPFIAQGYDAWTIAKQMNMIFGAIILIQVFFLFQKFGISNIAVYLLQLASAVAMVYFVYFQMFGDVLQLIFVLLYLHIIFPLSPSGISYRKAIFSGVIMGLAFYAKAYNMMFFMLHFLIVLGFRNTHPLMKFRKRVTLYFIGVLALGCMIFPWVLALHHKYGTWSASHAGTLNMSWYINSGKSFKPDIKLLIPPVYHDSPSFWEDPYLSQHNLSSPFTSLHHFTRWIFRIIHTGLICLFCFTEISFFSLAVLCISLFYFFYIKRKEGQAVEITNMKLLAFTVTVLPIGYLMMHIETRYIWLNVFLLMILGAFLLDEYFKSNPVGTGIRNVCYIIFAVSFIVYPVFQFENLKFKNKNLFEIAHFLNQNNIRGKFTSNVADAGNMWVIAYLTGSNYFTIEKSAYSSEELLKEMRRYQVKYYLLENSHLHLDVSLGEMKILKQYENFTIYQIE